MEADEDDHLVCELTIQRDTGYRRKNRLKQRVQSDYGLGKNIFLSLDMRPAAVDLGVSRIEWGLELDKMTQGEGKEGNVGQNPGE